LEWRFLNFAAGDAKKPNHLINLIVFFLENMDLMFIATIAG
jgi:hypothetical protein